jgi:acetyl esterase
MAKWRRFAMSLGLAARGALRAPLQADGYRMDRRTSEIVRMVRATASGKAMPDGEAALPAMRARYEATATLTALPPDPRVTSRDLTIAGCQAREYIPRGGAAGTLLYLHGGGFIMGSLHSHDGLCRHLAACSARRVVAISYRLAPEHPFPAAFEDARAAFAWARETERGDLAVGGDSAGGNLAAGLAQSERAAGISRQFLLYPALDMLGGYPSEKLFADGFLLTAEGMLLCREMYVPAGLDRADPRLSPLSGDLSGIAPAIVVTAGFDPLRDQGRVYVTALQSAGVEATLIEEGALVHGFADFAGIVPASARAITGAARMLRVSP